MATINPKDNDDKVFLYDLIMALNHEQTKKDPQRIKKVKPFIDQYNWNEILHQILEKTGNSFS